MSKTYSIAIDGPAGAGKSTIAKRLAKELQQIRSNSTAAKAKQIEEERTENNNEE